MVINYFGNGAFRLQNGDVSLLVDPENNRLKADVVLKTLTSAVDYSPAKISEGNSGGQAEIAFAGEYETKGVEITGIGIAEESNDKFVKTAYLVVWDDIKVALLGHLSKTPSAEVMEKLDEPDVVILPAGGGHFLEPAAAAKLVRQLEPAVVIPSFTKNAQEFVKAVGLKSETEEKFVFKKKDLEAEKGRVVILKSA